MKHASCLSTAEHVTRNKNEPVTKGKRAGSTFCFSIPQKQQRGHTVLLESISLLLTQGRNTFAIQRQIKQGRVCVVCGFTDAVIC